MAEVPHRHDSPSGISAANARLRQRHRLVWWLAAVAAVLVHAGLLFFTPAFATFSDSTQPRMVVVLGEWQQPPPPDSTTFQSAGAGLDTMQVPVLANEGIVQHRVSRIYPYPLWKEREPASALVEVAINRRGRVAAVKVLEPSEVGADVALVELVRMMRFSLPATDASAGFVGVVEVGVTPPWRASR